MIKRIGIIHQSEIIRKGLATMIRSFFNLEIHNFSDPDGLIQQKDLHESLCCIIIEFNELFKIKMNSLKVNEDLKIIIYFKNIESGTISAGDEKIDSLTPSVDLQEIIARCIKSREQKIGYQNGSELSIREQDVLKLISLGHSNKEIADKLFISIHTVISHRKNITEKLGIKSIPGLTVYAILNKLIDTDNINPENLI